MAKNTPTGIAVDASGYPVKDPTANVLDLVRAAIERQDDLRKSESEHIRELLGVRAGYDEQLRTQESRRIDAIRQVDVSAVARAAEVSAAQAQTLATQQQASADALRNQVEQARIATADALAQALAPITRSIEDLRAAQYQQQGEKSSKTETSTSDRDATALEAVRIQAASARTQVYALIIAALVLVAGLYATFHK
jgi:hypothetical protein